MIARWLRATFDIQLPRKQEMPYAVEMYFDQAADSAVRHVWQAIADAGFKSPMLEAGYRPHVSLGVYDSDTPNVGELQQALLAFAGKVAPFPLDLSSIGIFPTPEGVLFLGATVTHQLREIHKGYHVAFEAFASELRPYYRLDWWVPHCTLACGLTAEEIAAILPLCWQTPLPLRASVQTIGMAKVFPTSCTFVAQVALDRAQSD